MMVAGTTSLVGPYWVAGDLAGAVNAVVLKQNDIMLPFQGADGGMYMIIIEGTV